MKNDILSMKLHCTNNQSCIFTGNDITIEVTFKNISSHEIGIPIEYLQKKGPALTLTDKQKNIKTILRSGLANHSLMRRFKKITPGETVSIHSTVKGIEILSIRKKYIDLFLDAGIAIKIKIDDSDDLSDFIATSTIRIVGKDTLERDEKQNY